MMNDKALLTPEEEEVLELLAEAWNKFVLLPFQQPGEQNEFMRALHEMQRLVLARPVVRSQDFVGSHFVHESDE